MAILLLSTVLALAALVAVSGTTAKSTAATGSCPSSYHCGDTVEILYPFWVADGNITHLECGHPGLRLECRRGAPVLPLPSGDYSVTRILYGATDRKVSLVDVAFAMESTCPHVADRRNLTLPAGSPPPLTLTDHDANVTFYTDCRFEGIPNQRVRCLDTEDGKHTYAFRDDDFPMRYAYSKLCDGVVTVPVLRRSVAKNSTAPPLEDLMAQLSGGFELRWTIA